MSGQKKSEIFVEKSIANTDRHTRRARVLRAATVAAIGIAASQFFAGGNAAFADTSWSGGTSQDWNNGANWGTNPPTGNFIINTATGNYPILSADSAFIPVDVLVGDSGSSGQLDLTAGSLSLADTGADNHFGNWFMVGRAGGTGTLNVNGSASLNVGKLQAGGAYYAPGGTGTININTTGTVNANSNASYDYIFGGSSYASIVLGVGDFGSNLGTGTLNLQAGTVNAYGEIWVGSHGGTGTLNQTGGIINTSGLALTRWRGSGTASVSNGTLNAGFVNLTQAGSPSDLVTGTLSVGNGGVVNSEGDFTVAFAGSSDSVGTLNVNAGGVVNVGTTTERWLLVSRYDTLKGILNINGGTLNLNANTDIRFSTQGNTGANVINLNSGAITAWGGNQADAATGSVVDMNQGGGDAVNNTFNLNGGTLTVNQVISTAANGTKTFNFNGGTLKAAGATDALVSGMTNAFVQNGGAHIDTNGYDVTLPQALVPDSGSTGGLVKTGAGTLTLTGVNGYTGATVVQGGAVKVTYSSILVSSATPVLSGGGADLQNTGKLLFDYTGDTSPVATIKSLLTSGYASGFATGQIRSTVHASGATLGYGDDGAGTVTVQVTLPGDANLDGVVNFNDFLVLQANFGATSTRFDQGNFNYDNATDFNDFLLLQANFGQSLTGAAVPVTAQQVAAMNAFAAAVPEPASLAAVGLGAAGILRRRRRSA